MALNLVKSHGKLTPPISATATILDDRECITIGRMPSARLNFKSDFISRNHAVIERDPGTDDWYLVPQKQTSRTYIEGVHIKPGSRTLLQEGNLIQFGTSSIKADYFIYRFSVPSPANPQPSTSATIQSATLKPNLSVDIEQQSETITVTTQPDSRNSLLQSTISNSSSNNSNPQPTLVTLSSDSSPEESSPIVVEPPDLILSAANTSALDDTSLVSNRENSPDLQQISEVVTVTTVSYTTTETTSNLVSTTPKSTSDLLISIQSPPSTSYDQQNTPATIDLTASSPQPEFTTRMDRNLNITVTRRVTNSQQSKPTTEDRTKGSNSDQCKQSHEDSAKASNSHHSKQSHEDGTKASDSHHPKQSHEDGAKERDSHHSKQSHEDGAKERDSHHSKQSHEDGAKERDSHHSKQSHEDGTNASDSHHSKQSHEDDAKERDSHHSKQSHEDGANGSNSRKRTRGDETIESNNKKQRVSDSDVLWPSDEDDDIIFVEENEFKPVVNALNKKVQQEKDRELSELRRRLKDLEAAHSSKVSEMELKLKQTEEEKRKIATEGTSIDVRERFNELLEEGLNCSICSEIFTKPKTLNPCSHIYCTYCIDIWLTKKRECPICRAKVISAQPFHMLESYISKAVETLSEEKNVRRQTILKERDDECAAQEKEKKGKAKACSYNTRSSNNNSDNRNGASTSANNRTVAGSTGTELANRILTNNRASRSSSSRTLDQSNSRASQNSTSKTTNQAASDSSNQNTSANYQEIDWAQLLSNHPADDTFPEDSWSESSFPDSSGSVDNERLEFMEQYEMEGGDEVHESFEDWLQENIGSLPHHTPYNGYPPRRYHTMGFGRCYNCGDPGHWRPECPLLYAD